MRTRRATGGGTRGVHLALLYIAGNVSLAEKVKRILKDARIDFVANLEPYTTGSFLLGGWEYKGLFFYVPTHRFHFCRDLLHSNGVGDTLDLEGPPDGA